MNEENKLKEEIQKYLHEDSFLNRKEYTEALYSLISDVSVKFAKWAIQNTYEYEGRWVINGAINYDETGENFIGHSDEELFNYFINNIYGK